MPAGGPLNILAIEPFCGGYRRRMVELIRAHSRHRWDWRTLPARRMHRRLATAAEWFAEDLELHPPRFATSDKPAAGRVGERVDVLFTTEALHLGNLLRQARVLEPAAKVQYVHDHGENALPTRSREYRFCPRPPGVETTHLMSAAVLAHQPRGQIWFASAYHAAAFLTHIDEMYREYGGRFRDDPRPLLEDRARVVPPPVSTQFDDDPPVERPDRRRLVVSAEACDAEALNDLFSRIMTRGEEFDLLTIGMIPDLKGVPHRIIPADDERAICDAFKTARTYLAVGRDVWFDPWAVRALRANLWLLVPGQTREAFYEELIPTFLHPACLHDETPGRIINQLQNAWHAGRPEIGDRDMAAAIEPYDPPTAVREMDDRLEALSASA